MKKVLLLALFIASVVFSYGQTEITPNIKSYRFNAEDCNEGQFYLGEFVIGKYEISGNIGGKYADNRGWKIIIGKNWGMGKPQLKEIYNNIGGRFFYKQTVNNKFHLWWDSEYYRECDFEWTPYIKVEYEKGGWAPNITEPARSDGFFISEPKDARTDDLYVGKKNISGKFGAGNKLYFGGTDQNSDPTEMYRYAVSRDVTQLRVRIGDGLSNSDKFIIGTTRNNAGEWYSNFTLSGSGVGYFRSKLGIGVTNPSSLLEIKSEANKNSELHINTTTADDASIIRFQNAGQNLWGFLSNYPSAGKLSLYNYQRL